MANAQVTTTTPKTVNFQQCFSAQGNHPAELATDSKNRGYIVNGAGQVISPDSLRIGEKAYYAVYRSGDYPDIKLTQTQSVNLIPLAVIEIQKITLQNSSKTGGVVFGLAELFVFFFPKLDKREVKGKQGTTASWRVLTSLCGECANKTMLTTMNFLYPLTQNPEQYHELTVGVFTKD